MEFAGNTKPRLPEPKKDKHIICLVLGGVVIVEVQAMKAYSSVGQSATNVLVVVECCVEFQRKGYAR